jgi:DNA-binding GntR family transcriptional regulator
MLRYQLVRAPRTSEHMLDSVADHEVIYDALEHRSGKQARAAAERHARRSATRLATLLKSTPDGDGLA